jgi:hypothetical protein
VSELVHRVDALARFVRTVSPHFREEVPATVAPERVAAAGALAERASARLRLSSDHTVVALAGATGSGKSSLFNAIAGMRLSPPGHLRPTTAQPHACVWGGADAGGLLDWLGVAPEMRFSRESLLDADDEAALRGLVLLDLPDVDSVAIGHRIEADRLVGIADLVVWVLDPQKYADQTVHDEYLRHMSALREVTVVVFNQIDRLSAADAMRCQADLGRLVAADGLGDVPVIATSTVTGAGIGDVRALLEKTVAGRRTALVRLEAEVDATVAMLGALVGDSRRDEEVSRTEIAGLADGLGAAAGVDAVASADAEAYTARSALPWSTRRARTRRRLGDDPPPAEPTAVELAVRRLAEQTTAGLPAPWPEEVRRAAATDLHRLPADLGEAVRAARPRPPSAIGWWIGRLLFWLGATAAVGGTVWYALARYGPVRQPRLALPGLDDVPVGLAAAVAGAALAGMVLVIGRALAAAGARRLRARTEKRLRDAVASVAREVVGPVRRVLRHHADARAALDEAGGRLRA